MLLSFHAVKNSPHKLVPQDVEAFEKQAARAGINRLRQLFNAGNFHEAEQLAAHAPQMLSGRNLPRGSALKTLGAGSEGVAQHVLMPQGGTAVVKTYDKTSPLYSPAVQQTRASLAGKQIPGHAQTYSFHDTPQAQYAINEYVPTSKARPSPAQIQAAQAQARHAVPGHELLDIGPQNHVLDARTGQSKIIDSIPVDKRDLMPQHLRQGRPENVINFHLDPTSATGQTVNAFKENQPTWGRDTVVQQLNNNAHGPTMAGNQLENTATRMHSDQLLQQAYGRAPQAPQGVQAPQAPQQAQATQAARPARMQQPQATQAARPGRMTPQAVEQTTQAARPGRMVPGQVV